MGTFVPFWCLYPKGSQIPRNRAQEEVASPASPATMARNPLNERVDFAWNLIKRLVGIVKNINPWLIISFREQINVIARARGDKEGKVQESAPPPLFPEGYAAEE